MTPGHDEMREWSGLYIVGALAPDDRAAFEAHLAGCAECRAEVRALRMVGHALAAGVPLVDPPASLRERVLAATRPASVRGSAAEGPSATMAPGAPPRGTPLWRTSWLAVAALLIIAVGTGIYASRLQMRLDGVARQLERTEAALAGAEQRAQVAEQDVTRVRANLAVLTTPDVRPVPLAPNVGAPGATARTFVSPSRGVLFAASNMPALTPERRYQLWFLTGSGPVSAGLLESDAQGNVTGRFDVPPSVGDPRAFAVSIEPRGGVTSPTGPIVLATP